MANTQARKAGPRRRLPQAQAHGSRRTPAPSQPMPTPAAPHFDDGLTFWDDGSTYDSAGSPPTSPLTPTPPLTLQTAMEFWEVTKNRAQETLPVWTQYAPTLTVGGKTPADLEALIDGFEPLVQARTLAQDSVDAAYFAIQDALQRMRVLGTRVPQIIEGQLDENALLMKDVDELFRTSPRTESTILKRLRMLLPVWQRANAALAAMTPAQPPITRTVGGIVYTAAAATALLDGYTELIKTHKGQEEELDICRQELAAHDRVCDQLNKRWYKVAKATADPGQPLYDELEDITTEPGTAAPEIIEIDHATQGGEGGLEVLVSYEPGGGARATQKTVKWQIIGVDAGYVRSAALDPSGNNLGAFTVGQTVRIITEVSNSAGTRTSAPRTLTLGEPVV